MSRILYIHASFSKDEKKHKLKLVDAAILEKQKKFQLPYTEFVTHRENDDKLY